MPPTGERVMDFYEVVDQVVDLLRQRERVTYRSLQAHFQLDDKQLELLKDEILYAHESAVQADDRGFAWTGDKGSAGQPTSATAPSKLEPVSPATITPEPEPLSYTPPYLAEKILTSREALEGERKQVTVCFADIKDSTELIKDLDPEAAQQLLDPAIHIMMDAVHRFEGTVNQVLGDGIMSIFGAPIAHEDHAARACYAALAMQGAMRDYTEDVRRTHGIPLQIRVGLNAGEVVVRSIGNDLHMDYSAVGATTHMAARLEQLATPGRIMLSAGTLHLVEGFVRVNALGALPIKGMTEPVEVYELTGASTIQRRLQAAVARGLTQFVGRDAELEALGHARAQAEVGHGQIVAAVGEPGVGKSRLTYEFIHSHHTQSWRVLESTSVSYGKATPYFPVVELLKRYFHVEEGDESRTIQAKVTGQLLTLDESLQEMIPPVLSLLDVLPEESPFHRLDPQQRRQRTLDALKGILLRESQVQPLLVVFEDLHWIDSETQALLDSLIESLPIAPILLVVNYRPEYHHHWGSKTYYTQLRLDPLPPESADVFLQALIGDDSSLAPLKKLLIARTEGNPFFLEESVRTFVETQVLVGKPGAYRLIQELPSLEVPATVHAILAARIDRLSAEAKRLVQMASVIGMEVPLSILRVMAEMPDETLYSHLAQLQGAEFLYETTLFPERIYTFKHALTQNVAYQSLLQSTRQQYHRQIAHALEDPLAGAFETQPELLAHHFTQGEVWDKAFDNLAKSGEKARQAYANQEAIAFYTQAIEVSERITPPLPDEKLMSVYEGRGLVWFLLTNYDEAIGDFEQMRQIANRSGQPHHEGESLCHLASAHYYKYSEDHLPMVEQYAQEAQHLAQDLGDHNILARSLHILGNVESWRGNMPEADRTLAASLQISQREGYKDALAPTFRSLSSQACWQGNFSQSIHFAQQGVAVSREIHDGFHELYNLAFLSLSQWSHGDYAQAFRVVHEVMTKADERQNLFFYSRMKNHLGWFHRELGAVSQAAELDYESAELGRLHGISNVEISAMVNLGFDYLALEQYEDARTYLEPTLDRIIREAFGSHRWRWTIKLLIGLAEFCLMTGDHEQALHYVNEGLKEAQRTSSQKYIALGWALRGKIAAKLGNTDSAGTELKRAYTLADQLQSPSLIYPIAYNLGQWLEGTWNESEAVSFYGKAKATTEQIATAVEDEALRDTFLESALVQEIHQRARCLGG